MILNKFLYGFVVVSFLALSGIVFPAHSSQGEGGKEIVFEVHPYLPAMEIHKRFSPLVKYLAEKTGRSIRLEVAQNYATHNHNIARGSVDIAFMGPVPYVRMVQQYGRKILLAKLEVDGAAIFHGVIVVRNDSSITSLDDLKGKSFAFGEIGSTMADKMPKYMLRQAGVSEKEFSRVLHLGSHNNVALAVLGGYFDAGSIKEAVYYKYRYRGLRMLFKSPPVANHPFVARSNLSPELVQTIRHAFMDLNNTPEGLLILQSIQKSATGIVSAEDSDYDVLRDVVVGAEEERL